MSIFHIFRYQILPNDRHFQGSIYDGRSVNNVIADKNIIFWEALHNADPFSTTRAPSVTQTLAEQTDFLVLRVGVAKKIIRSTEDFKEEQLDHWPSAIVIIWNDDEKQILAVQHNPGAFKSPDVIVNRFQKGINASLAPFQLKLHIKPIYDKRIFWDLIEKNKGNIEQLEITYLTPNMASISKSLTEDLKSLAKITNSSKNDLKLRAEKNASLAISRDNSQIAGLVDYASSGGGPIKVKLHSMSKKITVGKETKELSIKGLEIEGDLTPEYIEGLKEILDV